MRALFIRPPAKTDAWYDVLTSQGILAAKYHAGLPEEGRKEVQQAFIRDEKTVMVAINAFGMAIDKLNVRFVNWRKKVTGK